MRTDGTTAMWPLSVLEEGMSIPPHMWARNGHPVSKAVHRPRGTMENRAYFNRRLAGRGGRLSRT